MPLQNFLNTINPKKLFLIDSIGALVSALMLGIVLVQLEDIIGMPPNILYILSLLAVAFSIYSFSCFVGFPERWPLFLKIIAIVNLMYCCLTMGMVIYFGSGLTVLGILYFVMEVMIISTLVIIELKTANRFHKT